jgi:hypothetical protein
MRIAQSGLLLNRNTGQMSGTVSFTNMSNATISGILMFRLDYLSSGVTLDNRNGSQGGSPTLGLPVSSLAPGASATVTTVFANPSRVGIAYTPKLFAGTP